MGAMATQIISLIIIYSTVHSGANEKKSKFRVPGLWAGNSPVTSEFPAQMTSNVGMFPFDGIIMEINKQNLNYINQLTDLTLCVLVTPYRDTDLGQYWLTLLLIAWRHQAITWVSVLTSHQWGPVTFIWGKF